MSEMVDRVAEALWGNPANKRAGDWASFDEKAKELWRDDARRAITAMREPTAEMKAVVYWVENSDLPPGWYAMFDAALA